MPSVALARGWRHEADTGKILKDLARHDPKEGVRRCVIDELAWGWDSDPEVSPLLKNRARHDHDGLVATVALRELVFGWGHDPEVRPLLVDTLRSHMQWCAERRNKLQAACRDRSNTNRVGEKLRRTEVDSSWRKADPDAQAHLSTGHLHCLQCGLPQPTVTASALTKG